MHSTPNDPDPQESRAIREFDGQRILRRAMEVEADEPNPRADFFFIVKSYGGNKRGEKR